MGWMRRRGCRRTARRFSQWGLRRLGRWVGGSLSGNSALQNSCQNRRGNPGVTMTKMCAKGSLLFLVGFSFLQTPAAWSRDAELSIGERVQASTNLEETLPEIGGGLKARRAFALGSALRSSASLARGLRNFFRTSPEAAADLFEQGASQVNNAVFDHLLESEVDALVEQAREKLKESGAPSAVIKVEVVTNKISGRPQIRQLRIVGVGGDPAGIVREDSGQNAEGPTLRSGHLRFEDPYETASGVRLTLNPHFWALDVTRSYHLIVKSGSVRPSRAPFHLGRSAADEREPLEVAGGICRTKAEAAAEAARQDRAAGEIASRSARNRGWGEAREPMEHYEAGQSDRGDVGTEGDGGDESFEGGTVQMREIETGREGPIEPIDPIDPIDPPEPEPQGDQILP